MGRVVGSGSWVAGSGGGGGGRRRRSISSSSSSSSSGSSSGEVRVDVGRVDVVRGDGER